MDSNLKGLFLCGCNPDEKKHYSTFTSADGKVNTHRRFDREGFEICPEHGLRMYGWRSPMMVGPQGNDILDWRQVSKVFEVQPAK